MGGVLENSSILFYNFGMKISRPETAPLYLTFQNNYVFVTSGNQTYKTSLTDMTPNPEIWLLHEGDSSLVFVGNQMVLQVPLIFGGSGRIEFYDFQNGTAGGIPIGASMLSISSQSGHSFFSKIK